MNVFIVIFVWMLMALILVAGIVLAVKGSFWLLGLGLVGFILALTKIGCLTH